MKRIEYINSHTCEVQTSFLLESRGSNSGNNGIENHQNNCTSSNLKKAIYSNPIAI